jgi:rubrerythrin
MEKPKFYIKGDNLSGVDKKVLGVHKEIIEESFSEGKRLFTGEEKKSPELSEGIEYLNYYLNEELVDLGLKKIETDQRTIHVLPDAVFNKVIDEPDTLSFYYFNENSILVRDQSSRMLVLRLILHEMVHQASFHTVFKNTDKKLIYPLRSGYQGFKPNDLESKDRFVGLNEAVVDSITQEIINKHKEDLNIKFNFSEEELKTDELLSNSYSDYIDILNIIIDKISEEKGEDRESIWKNFKKGEFTGNMMYLRDVEKYFGVGALRILSSFGDYNDRNNYELLIDKTKEYFKSYGNPDLQSKIAKEILSEKDFIEYEKMQNKYAK